MLCFLLRGLFTLEIVNKSWNFKVAPSAIGAVIPRSTIFFISVERSEAVFPVTNDFPGSLICVRVCVCEGERTCACVCGEGGGNGTHEQYRRSHEPYPPPPFHQHTHTQIIPKHCKQTSTTFRSACAPVSSTYTYTSQLLCNCSSNV